MSSPAAAMLMWPSFVSKTPVGCRWGGCCRPAAAPRGHQPARGLEVEHREHRLQQRRVHPLALARALALDQRDQDALRQEDARAEVGDRDADPHRPLARKAGDRHEAAHALGDLVDARAVAVRPGLAEAGDAAVDDARVDRRKRLVVDAQALFDARAIVLDDDVGVWRELLEDRDALRISEVEGHASLVAVQVLEVEAVAIAAHAVAGAAAGHLDLDGVRPPSRPAAARTSGRPGRG